MSDRGTASVSGAYLRLISRGEELILDSTDGTETLAEASDVFDWISERFEEYGTNVPGTPTEATPVEVHEMARNAVFRDMIPDDEAFFFQQSQVKNFVKKYPDWLRKDGYATFLPFKVRKVVDNEEKIERFVADVSLNSGDELYAHVYRFSGGDLWSAGNRHRVVLPQLEN